MFTYNAPNVKSFVDGAMVTIFDAAATNALETSFESTPDQTANSPVSNLTIFNLGKAFGGGSSFATMYPTSLSNTAFLNEVAFNLTGSAITIPAELNAFLNEFTRINNLVTTGQLTLSQNQIRGVVAAEFVASVLGVVADANLNLSPSDLATFQHQQAAAFNRTGVSGSYADATLTAPSLVSTTVGDAAWVASLNALKGVTSDTVTVTVADAQISAAQAANNPALITGQVLGFTLTPNIDTFTATATGAEFNALPFVQSSGLLNNTLNTGDNLQDSFNDGTLNYTTSPNGVAANPPFALGVTLNGISTANITNQSADVAGFQGGKSVTGLTTVNDTSSVAGVRVGGPGQGVDATGPVLSTVNISSFGGANSNVVPVFNGIIAAGSASNTINVGITGALGGTALAGAAALQFTNDGGPGSAANPNLSYGTWAITTANNVDLQLQQGGVGAATALKLSGAGNVAVGQDAQGNWQKVTTIDASGETGTVFITGASSQLDAKAPPPFHNAFATAANPGWLFGSNAGLLDDTGTGGAFNLTSFKLGSGTNFLDVSSASATQVAALTTTPGSLVALNNEIIVKDSVATTISATTFANINGFQILGIGGPTGTGAGGGDGAGGIIDMANLPAAIGTILYQTPASGGVTINDVTSTLTVNTEDNAFGFGLTVGAVGPNPGFNDTLNVIVGNASHHTTGFLGNVTAFGEENVNFTAQSGVPSTVPATTATTDLIGTVLLTPTVTSFEHVTIGGDTDVAFGIGSAGGSIFSVNAAATAFNVNNLTITDTNAAGTYLSFNTGSSYSTNAVVIDATQSGTDGTVGLVMRGGDANFLSAGLANQALSAPNPNDAGDTISGSHTSGNILIGSLGNDTINGTTNTNVADTIVTNGGGDTINLALNHTASDHIGLFVGFAPANPINTLPGQAATAVAGSILDPNAVSQQGFWGNSPGVTGGVPAEVLNGTGTSADLSTINNFNVTTDVIDLSLTAWGVTLPSFLTDAKGTPLDVGNEGNAVFTNSIGPGGSVTATAGADVIFFGQGTFANAATLAGVLASASGAIKFNFALTAGSVDDFIVAYQDLNNRTVIADLQIENTTKATIAAGFTTATKGLDLAVSDMATLTGVTLPHLANHDIHFIG